MEAYTEEEILRKMTEQNNLNQKDQKYVENFNQSDNEWVVLHHHGEPTVEHIEDLEGVHHQYMDSMFKEVKGIHQP